MNRIAFRKIRFLIVLCIAAMLFALNFPMISYGEDISVRVAQNIVNITSQGEGHPIVVHTNQDYDDVDFEKEVKVYVNDCKIETPGTRRDDLGFLDIYFFLVKLQACGEGQLYINDESNVVGISGYGIDDSGVGYKFYGEGFMHIVGMQGPGKP